MSIVHRTYARALYDAAAERRRVAQVGEELAGFVEAVRTVPALRSLLENPKLDPRARGRALDDLLGGGEQLVRNFVRLLAEKGRAADVEEVAREFERIVAAREGQLSVELTTAYELSDDEAAAILAQIEQASGRRVEAERRVDRELIGGIVLQAGSLRVDASVRGRLERLRHELTSST